MTSNKKMEARIGSVRRETMKSSGPAIFVMTCYDVFERIARVCVYTYI